jgi:predicted RNA methylase
MLQPLEPDKAAVLREFLAAQDYTDAKLREIFGTRIPLPTVHPDMPKMLAASAMPSAFHCLARWFFSGLPVSSDVVSEYVPDSIRVILEQCGLIVIDQVGWQPTALLVPHEGLWIASDSYQRLKSESPAEYVPTVSAPADALLQFAVRRPVRATLDLCSGCAVHALAASGFSERVVAVDLNPRAKMFAEFNVALNGCGNVQPIVGDLFQPVEGELFDLILSNPPFVMTPSRDFLFRDNPLELDGFCGQIITAVPRFLRENGFFQLVCEWVELQDQDWQQRMRGWFADSGCDVWVLEANRERPNSYVDDWVRQNYSLHREEEQIDPAEWIRYFEQRNVAAIHGGLIAMRRRDGENWVSFSRLPKVLTEPVGESVLQAFAVRDLLHNRSRESDLLSLRLRVAPAAELNQTLHWRSGRWQTASASLRLTEGVPVAVGVDDNVRELLSYMDGQRTLGEAIQAFADRLRLPADAIRSQCVGMARRMMEHSCLIPEMDR